MKRLIKSEFYDSYKSKYDDYFECFINPNLSEFQNIEKTNKNNNVRGMIDRNSNFYIWNGDLSHYSAVSAFNIPDIIHVDIFNRDIASMTSYLSFEEHKKLIGDCTSFLKIFNMNTKIDVFICDRKHYENIKTLNDLLNN